MPPRALRVVLWSTVILFSLLGIVSVISRGVLLTTAASENLSDVEKQVLEMMYGHSPRKLEALEEAPKITGRFVRHRLLAMLHIIPGGLFLAFAPLQFSSKFRNRHLDFHRRTGRVLIISACLSAMAALFFGVIIPYAGPAEVSSTGLFGALFLIALGKAFLAIRRGDVAQHREWMIRAFAIGIGISTIRVLVAFMQRFMQLSPRALIGWSFWIGWSITLLAGEAWIRYTRRSRQTESVAGTGVGAPAVSGGL